MNAARIMMWHHCWSIDVLCCLPLFCRLFIFLLFFQPPRLALFLTFLNSSWGSHSPTKQAETPLNVAKTFLCKDPAEVQPVQFVQCPSIPETIPEIHILPSCTISPNMYSFVLSSILACSTGNNSKHYLWGHAFSSVTLLHTLHNLIALTTHVVGIIPIQMRLGEVWTGRMKQTEGTHTEWINNR